MGRRSAAAARGGAGTGQLELLLAGEAQVPEVEAPPPQAPEQEGRRQEPPPNGRPTVEAPKVQVRIEGPARGLCPGAKVERRPRSNGGIEDFGEVIHGARKHLAQERLEEAVRRYPEAAAHLTLAQIWPVGDWKREAVREGADPERVAWHRALRDQVGTKPTGRRVRHRLPRWLREVTALRTIALAVIAQEMDPGEIEGRLKRSTEAKIEPVALHQKLYAALGHERSFQRVEVGQVLGKDPGEKSSTWRWAVTEGGGWGRSRIAESPSYAQVVERAVAVLGMEEAEKTEDGPSKRKHKFEVRVYRKECEEPYTVGKKWEGQWVELARCKTLLEARRIAREEEEMLVARWRRWRDVPSCRKGSNAERTPEGTEGVESPQAFEARLGLRGVQFGNWVEYARRGSDLRDASQAFHDLARVMGIPVEGVSLGGRLGLAFGARGKGGRRPAMAHYEPGQEVINLTKKAGPGSLAHEWWHAFDHAVGRSNGQRYGYASEAKGAGPDPLVRAVMEWGRAMRDVPMMVRSKILEKREKRSNPYWTTLREMTARAFEAWVRWTLEAEHGIVNDYLVNLTSIEDWKGKAREGLEMDGGWPYPMGEEDWKVVDTHMERIRSEAWRILDKEAGAERRLAANR